MTFAGARLLPLADWSCLGHFQKNCGPRGDFSEMMLKGRVPCNLPGGGEIVGESGPTSLLALRRTVNSTNR